MTPTEQTLLISRARREMPRNSTVMLLCDLLEHLVIASEVKAVAPTLTRAQIQKNYRDRKRVAK